MADDLDEFRRIVARAHAVDDQRKAAHEDQIDEFVNALSLNVHERESLRLVIHADYGYAPSIREVLEQERRAAGSVPREGESDGHSAHLRN